MSERMCRCCGSLPKCTGALSQNEVMRLVREQADAHEELPETTWRRLREYQILVPSEPGGESASWPSRSHGC